ncbi:MAG: hypothetical protein ACC652_03020 [Acidimicrobiales bacterium]
MTHPKRDTLLILPENDEARETITEHLFSAAVISAIAGQWGAVRRDFLLAPMNDDRTTN